MALVGVPGANTGPGPCRAPVGPACPGILRLPPGLSSARPWGFGQFTGRPAGFRAFRPNLASAGPGYGIWHYNAGRVLAIGPGFALRGQVSGRPAHAFAIRPVGPLATPVRPFGLALPLSAFSSVAIQAVQFIHNSPVRWVAASPVSRRSGITSARARHFSSRHSPGSNNMIRVSFVSPPRLSAG